MSSKTPMITKKVTPVFVEGVNELTVIAGDPTRLREQVEAAQAVALPRLVREFCEGQKWAAQAWKDQPHIKPLFDFASSTPDH